MLKASFSFHNIFTLFK